MEIYHSGALSAYISPDGILGITQNYGGTYKVNTVINGSLGNPSAQYRSTVIGAGCSIASGAGVGEATAIGVFSTAAGQYSTAIGYSANAGNTSVALGFQPSATAARASQLGSQATDPENKAALEGQRARLSSMRGSINFSTA